MFGWVILFIFYAFCVIHFFECFVCFVKFVKCASVNNLSVFHKENFVHIFNCAQPMRHNNNCAFTFDFVNAFFDCVLGKVVQTAGAFVQNYYA